MKRTIAIAGLALALAPANAAAKPTIPHERALAAATAHARHEVREFHGRDFKRLGCHWQSNRARWRCDFSAYYPWNAIANEHSPFTMRWPVYVNLRHGRVHRWSYGGSEEIHG